MQECDPCIYCKMITTRLLNSHTIWYNYHFLLEHLGNFQALISNWSLPANGMQSVPSMWGGQPAKSRKGTSSMLVGSLQCLLLSPEHWWTSSTSVRIKGRGGDRRQGFLVCVCVCVCVCIRAQSCLNPCDPMDCSTPGLPVHHQLPELTQTHVYRVGDAIQPSRPLSSPSPPAFHLSQHQGLFQTVGSWHQVAKGSLGIV